MSAHDLRNIGVHNMGISIVEYIDREIATYCAYHWSDYQIAGNNPFNLAEFRNCFIFQLIKDAYYQMEPKNSLRHHRGTDDDAARMQDSRNIAYAQHYRDLQYNRLAAVGIYVPELLPEKVGTREEKLHGHEKTAMQYFELKSIEQYPLLKAIVSKRICDVKKISNATFKEYMQDYDELTHNLAKGLDGNDEDVVFSAVALFTLEWKYPVELFYACAENAEKVGITDIPKTKITQLCTQQAQLCIPEAMKNLHTDSRFVLHRMQLVPLAYDDGFPWAVIEQKLYHYLVMSYYFKQSLIHNDSLVDYYAMVTSKKDWADFIRSSYDIKSIYREKEWTNSRIRYVRRLFDAMIMEMPTP